MVFGIRFAATERGSTPTIGSKTCAFFGVATTGFALSMPSDPCSRHAGRKASGDLRLALGRWGLDYAWWSAPLLEVGFDALSPARVGSESLPGSPASKGRVPRDMLRAANRDVVGNARGECRTRTGWAQRTGLVASWPSGNLGIEVKQPQTSTRARHRQQVGQDFFAEFVRSATEPPLPVDTGVWLTLQPTEAILVKSALGSPDVEAVRALAREAAAAVRENMPRPTGCRRISSGARRYVQSWPRAR